MNDKVETSGKEIGGGGKPKQNTAKVDSKKESIIAIAVAVVLALALLAALFLK